MTIGWNDIGIVLSTRKFGESDLIITVLTREHGKFSGLVKGGAGRKNKALYQIGNLLNLDWRARLPENLGTYRCESKNSFSAYALGDSIRLIEISALCAFANIVLPDREKYSVIFEQAYHLLLTLGSEVWLVEYVLWEINILNELGYGLDLGTCAVTGEKDNLIYVSPKTGRSVSQSAGEPYKNKLLKLPKFLISNDESKINSEEIICGLDLTEFFFLRHVFQLNNQLIPAARGRLRKIIPSLYN